MSNDSDLNIEILRDILPVSPYDSIDTFFIENYKMYLDKRINIDLVCQMIKNSYSIDDINTFIYRVNTDAIATTELLNSTAIKLLKKKNTYKKVSSIKRMYEMLGDYMRFVEYLLYKSVS